MDSILKFMSSYQDVLNTTDWYKLSAYFHEDCALLYSDGTYFGKPAVKKAFQKMYALMKNGKYVISNVKSAVITEKYCACVFHFRWSAQIYGHLISGEDRVSCYLVKVDNAWQIVNQHLGPVSK